VEGYIFGCGEPPLQGSGFHGRNAMKLRITFGMAALTYDKPMR
jgi:hypothetical protein